MDWIIPGTTLTARREDAQYIEQQFHAMFFAGGMVLSQVAGITGLEPYTIQNWVKRGFLTKPVGKRYTLRQLCRILNINMFKTVMPLEQVCRMLSYVNGNLDDESDDLIDDSVLYFLFVRLAANYSVMHNAQGRDAYLRELLADYARSKGDCVIVKGLRAGSDFENEFQMALINRKINPELDTMFLTSEHQFTYLSSSMVKELGSYEVDLTDFLPAAIIPDFRKRIEDIRQGGNT